MADLNSLQTDNVQVAALYVAWEMTQATNHEGNGETFQENRRQAFAKNYKAIMDVVQTATPPAKIESKSVSLRS